MASKSKLAWFNALEGPEELFRRVRFIMEPKGPFTIDRTLLGRFVDPESLASDELGALKSVKLKKWYVVGAEVRRDRGKFVTSTWERPIGRRRWRIVIGMNDRVLALRLVTGANSLPKSEPHELAFVRYVADVNHNLMATDRPGQFAPRALSTDPTPRATGNKRRTGVPGIDFPTPTPRLPKSKKPRQKVVMLGMKPTSIATLRAIAQSPRGTKDGRGRCRGCGAIAVLGSDTCYSCG